jgi:lysozyme family protein
MLGTKPLSANQPLYAPTSRFAVVGPHVLGIEGGYSNNMADKGGETNHGVSLRFLKLEGKIDLNQDGFADFDLDFDGDIDGADIRALTAQQSLNLFFHCFWDRYDLANLPKPIDAAIFDQAVNGGATAAFKMLQSSLNRMALAPSDLTVDGIWGNQSKARVGYAMRQAHGVETLLNNYRQAAEARYNAIARADSSQVVFLKGWVARARRLGDV